MLTAISLPVDLTQSNQQQQEILLNLFNAELDKWEKRWNILFEKSKTTHRLSNYFITPFHEMYLADRVLHSIPGPMPSVSIPILRFPHEIVHQLFAITNHAVLSDNWGKTGTMAVL